MARHHRAQRPASGQTEALLETRTSKQELETSPPSRPDGAPEPNSSAGDRQQLDQLLATAPGVAADGRSIGGSSVTRAWRGGEATPSSRAVSFEEWLEWLLTTRVTEKSGTFTRFDLTQAVAATLPAGTASTEVEATVNRALASPASCRSVITGANAAQSMPRRTVATT